MKTKGLLWIIVKDLKNRKACIVGPDSDDTLVFQEVHKQNSKGNDLNCQPIQYSENSLDNINESLKADGFEIVDSYTLIRI